METSSNKMRSLVWISLGAAGIALLPATHDFAHTNPSN